MAEQQPGQMVTPNVRLLELLGQGGMGCVWTAEHLALECRVAVKFLFADIARRDESMLTRFEREAKAAARITSPHVVRTFDYGLLNNETPFIVMELLEGESLNDRIERVGRVSARDMGQIVTQTAKALRQAHNLGIIHRDIKPDNLFLVDPGLGYSEGEPMVEDLFVKVLDFGIAKETHVGYPLGRVHRAKAAWGCDWASVWGHALHRRAAFLLWQKAREPPESYSRGGLTLRGGVVHTEAARRTSRNDGDRG